MIWKLIKLLVAVAILGGVGLVVYAYVGPVLFPSDFAAPAQTVTQDVTLNAD